MNPLKNPLNCFFNKQEPVKDAAHTKHKKAQKNKVQHEDITKISKKMHVEPQATAPRSASELSIKSESESIEVALKTLIPSTTTEKVQLTNKKASLKNTQSIEIARKMHTILDWKRGLQPVNITLGRNKTWEGVIDKLIGDNPDKEKILGRMASEFIYHDMSNARGPISVKEVLKFLDGYILLEDSSYSDKKHEIEMAFGDYYPVTSEEMLPKLMTFICQHVLQMVIHDIGQDWEKKLMV